MIRINLLPFRAARKKENVRRQVSVFLLSLVLVVIIAVIALQYGLIDDISRLPITKQAERLTGPTGPSVIIIGKKGASVIRNIFTTAP